MHKVRSHGVALFALAMRELHAPCAHRARTVRSFDIFIVTSSVSPPLQLRFIMSLSWVTPGTDVFYNRASMGDRVPAIVLGSSPQPGDFLRIQYEVGGKVVVHEAAALHRIEFQIRSPSPSPSLSPPQRHEQPQPEAPVEPNEDPPFQPENVDPGQQPQPEAPVEGSAPQPPPKRASKTSAQARERQKERHQAAKSVTIDISDEDTGTYGNHQTKKEKFQVYQQGPTGAELGTLGHMATIRLKKKNSRCTSRGQQGQN